MSWACLTLLLYWLESLALHALFAFEDWQRVKRKCMTPEREAIKKAWLREFHEVFLCGHAVRDAMCGAVPKAYWSHLRLTAEAVVREDEVNFFERRKESNNE